MNSEKRGRILKGIGGFYYVDTGNEIYECRARGKFRKLKITPFVGDEVVILSQADQTGYVSEILPRKNHLIRPAISNLDTVVIVVSGAPPVTDLFLIDRVSAVARQMDIEVIIAINKCDQNPGDELYDIYTRVGFTVLRVSGKTGEGLEQLHHCLSGKLSAFTGNSGVGKSTILNQIKPEFQLETGEINDKIGRGRHTTRHVEILKVKENTWVADTPGFSSFDTERMDLIDKESLERVFPEFLPYIDHCRFVGCTHSKDDGCAVYEAVENGAIPRSRHESYLKLYESLKTIKSWEKK